MSSRTSHISRVSAPPEISVIVPVYNSAGVVRAAITSAQEQSFRDLEIVCVDDGSTDESGSVLAEMALADPRIRVIELSSNRGASTARNRGLEEARGNHVFFLDSDDQLPPLALERLLTAARETGCELAIGKLLWIKSPTDAPDFDRSAPPGKVVITTLHDCAYLQTVSGSHCCNLYRRDLLDRNSIRYETGLTYGEDQLFQATAIAAAGPVAMLDEIVYVYHHYRGQSVTRTPPTLANLLDDIVFHRRIAQLLSGQGLDTASRRFLLGRWSYSIREYWLQIPAVLTIAQAKLFFSEFRAMVGANQMDPWNDSMPAHHRHALALVLEGRDEDAYEFLASSEARNGFAADPPGPSH